MVDISEKIREVRVIWLNYVEKDRGRCSNENVEVSGHQKIGRQRKM